MADILYNIKKVVITELDEATGMPKVGSIPINVKTAEEADIDPDISNGEKKVKRDDDQILAIAETPDLLIGYKLKLKDNLFTPEVASIIEGAKIVKQGDTVVGYDAPMMKDGATMKPFKLDMYVANYEGTSIKNYAKITFNYCTGKASKMSFKKDFYSPEFEVYAKENTKAGLSVKQVRYVDQLPPDDTTKPVVTMTSTGSVTIGNPVIAKVDKLGLLYLIPNGATATTKAQMDTLVNVGLSKMATIVATGIDTSIATTTLTAGSYKVYAVDLSGNISDPKSITLA